MNNKVTINGNEYSYGEIVESEFFDDKSKEIVLNGEVVKVGDVWLTRELKEVLITSISIGRWPIRDDKERTYSVYGIADSSYKISSQDLMTKLKDAENIGAYVITYDRCIVDDLPILDIQIGDVWETSEGKKVEIASHNPVGEFEWVSTEGLSYTNKGTYFSTMTSPTKDLVTRLIRTTEVDEAPVLDIPVNYADALRHSNIYVKDDAIDALRYSTIGNVCTEDTTINFENAVKMHMDSIVSLIGDRICEKVKSRDISTVKRLTKVLEKVIVLESL